MTVPVTDITAITPEGVVTETAGLTPVTKKGKRRRLRFIANGKAATGLVILGFFVLLAVIGPWISPHDPSQRSQELVQPPSAVHWFGTTHLGQDVFSQVLAARPKEALS